MAIKFLNGIDVEGSMNLHSDDIPNLNASKVTSGTFSTSRIPNLSASKITSGTINAARLPDLSGTYQPVGNYITSIPSEYLTQTEGDARYLKLSGGTLTGDLTINQNGSALNLRSTTNSQPSRITFSSDVPASQIGYIEYTHVNTASYGSLEAFIIGGSEANKTILADGKLMYAEGIYSKPSSGTGAGTRKDVNWDTAYGWGNHAGLYDAAGEADAVNQRIDSEVLPSIPTNNNQLTNGAGYITDGNTNWNNTYGFITEAPYIKAGGAGPSTENLNTIANSVVTGQLEYRGFNLASSNRPPASDNANGVITVGQHAGNYNAQLAFSSDGNMYFRDNPSSSFGSWRTVWDSGNFNPGDYQAAGSYLTTTGKAADSNLLDGINSTSFLRSDANDTFTANVLGFPTLSLGIANNNSDNGYGTYFRGNNTHFVLGLSSGNTLYLNYGNAAGTMRTYGNWYHGDTQIMTSDRALQNVTGNISMFTNDSGYAVASTLGSLALEDSVAWSEVTGKPSTFTPSAHSHNEIVENATITYGASKLQWTDQSGDGGTGLNGSSPDNPYSEWWHHIIMNHGNGNGYYVDIAACFHSDDLYFRRLTSGSLSSWREILHDGNISTFADVAGSAAAVNDRIENEVFPAIPTNNNQLTNGAGYLTSVPSSFTTGNVTVTGYIKGGGQQLVLSAGEAQNYATGQTAEYIYMNAEQGIQVNSETGNWSGGWAARKTAYLRGDQLTLDGESLTKTNIQNFKTAYGWGNHAGLYDGAGAADAVNNRIDSEVIPAIQTPAITSNGSTPSLNSGISAGEIRGLIGAQPSGTYNTIIGTDSDINTSGATIIDNIYVTDGVITSMGTRTLTLGNLGFTGATNANYITNNNQLTNGAGYITSADGGNADTVDGKHASTTRNSANTIPVRDGNGYLNLGWINTTSGNTTSTLTDIYVNTNDGYIRKATPAHFRSQITNGHYDTIGSAASVENNLQPQVDNALSVANTAQTTANSAQGTANTALTRAETALANIPTNNNQLTNGAGYVTATNHNHNSIYSQLGHNHDGQYLGAFGNQTLNGDLSVNGLSSDYLDTGYINDPQSGAAWLNTDHQGQGWTYIGNPVIMSGIVMKQGDGMTPKIETEMGISLLNKTPNEFRVQGGGVYGANQSLQIAQQFNGDDGMGYNGGDIYIGSAGLYEVSYSVTFRSNYANRSSFGLVGYSPVEGTYIRGSRNVQYFRFNSYGEYATISGTFYWNGPAGGILQIRTELLSGSASHQTFDSTNTRSNMIYVKQIREN